MHPQGSTPPNPYDDPYAATSEPTPSAPSRTLPVVALVIGVLAVVVAVAIQPSIVRGGSGSPQAVAIAVVAALLFAGFVLLMFRLIRQPVLLAAVVGGPLLVMAGVLGFTALVDDEANDEDAQELATQLADAEAGGSSADEVEAPVEDDGAGPEAAGPVRLSTGDFQGLDDHAASGTVSLVEQADGSRVVLFEDFEVERGPDYFVYLIAGDAAFDASAGVQVGPLQGNVGDQQYEVPEELSDQQPLTVLIWCRAFDVNIAGGVLT